MKETQSRTKVIVIHGTMGSPDVNWFRWLESQLPSETYSVHIPHFPTPENQSVENWYRTLCEQVPKIEENTILIGHSIGATFLLHILEKLKAPISKTIFVSVVMDEIHNQEYDALNKSFLRIPDFDWLTISNNAGDVYIMHGDNDPYVSRDHSAFLQDQIGGEFIVIPNGGHLNAESGYTEFPLLLDIINSVSSAAPQRTLCEAIQ